MKQTVIDEARKRWREQVDLIASRPYYKDQDRAEKFFFEVVTPIWRHVLGLPADMHPRQVMATLHVSPTMVLMLHFFGVAVLGKGGQRAPRITCWPPHVANGRMSFLRAVPKKDIAAIVGKTDGSVTSAIACLRGQKGKTGTVLFDKRLVFPAPLATGIMMDGAFEMQLSLPFFQTFVYDRDHYEAQAELAMTQRIQAGATWSQAHEWASAAVEERHGVKSVRIIREAMRRKQEAKQVESEREGMVN